MRHVFVYLVILILWQTKMKGSRKKTNTTKVYLKISRRKNTAEKRSWVILVATHIKCKKKPSSIRGMVVWIKQMQSIWNANRHVLITKLSSPRIMTRNKKNRTKAKDEKNNSNIRMGKVLETSQCHNKDFCHTRLMI